MHRPSDAYLHCPFSLLPLVILLFFSFLSDHHGAHAFSAPNFRAASLPRTGPSSTLTPPSSITRAHFGDTRGAAGASCAPRQCPTCKPVMRLGNDVEPSVAIEGAGCEVHGGGNVEHRSKMPVHHPGTKAAPETRAQRRSIIKGFRSARSRIHGLARAVMLSKPGARSEHSTQKSTSIALPAAAQTQNGGFGREQTYGGSGATRRRPGSYSLALVSRLARRTLLPSLVLAGFVPAASAAMGGGGLGPGVAASSAVLSPLLTSRWYVWAVLMASSSAGLWSERTRWGAAVSSPLVTMLLTITLCNVGVLPAASPAYDTVNQVFVPLAVPLLLFDADLQKVLRFAGTLLACFVIGAAGTVIGTAVAAAVVPLGLGGDGWKIASALAARHIGGAVNYVAVCETLGVSADAVVAGLAADNMVVSLYFIFLFWITKPEKQEDTKGSAAAAAAAVAAEAAVSAESSPPPEAIESPVETTAEAAAEADVASVAPPPLAVTKESISYALTAACALCLCGELLSKLAFGGRVSAIPLVTLATVAGATAAPSWVGRLGPVGAQLGVLLMQLFFAVTGAQGSLAVVMGTAPSLLVFSVVQIAVHFGVLVGVGRLFRLPFRELALASNANVGGPTTAAAMAAAKGWKNLVLPALLTGVLGYATATFIGVGIGHTFLKSLVGLT